MNIKTIADYVQMSHRISFYYRAGVAILFHSYHPGQLHEIIIVLVLMIALPASVSAAPAITDGYTIESRTSTMSFFNENKINLL